MEVVARERRRKDEGTGLVGREEGSFERQDFKEDITFETLNFIDCFPMDCDSDCDS